MRLRNRSRWHHRAPACDGLRLAWRPGLRCLAALLLRRSAPRRPRRRRSPGRCRPHRRFRRAALPVGAGPPRRLDAGRRQLPGHVRRQPLGVRRRARRGRLRRRPVPPRRRHEPQRVAARRPTADAVRRARAADRSRARSRHRRRGSHRHAEHASGVDAARPLSDRRHAGRAGDDRHRARGREPDRGRERGAAGACRPGRRPSRESIRWRPMSEADPASTGSTPGARIATATTSACKRRRTCRGRWSVPRSSTHTEAGKATRRTGRSGIRRPSRPTGPRTATATGPTSGRGASPGSIRRRGATRRRTTAAGCVSTIAGRGVRDLAPGGRTGRRRWSAGMAGRVGASRRTPARRSTAGCPSAGATRITRGGAAARNVAGVATTGRGR